MKLDDSPWPVVPLQQIVRMGSGGTPRAGDPRYYEGGTVPWAVIGDLTDGPVTHTRQAITAAAISESSAKVVPAGSILLAMYGSIGKLGIAGTAMATNQAIATLTPTEAVSSKWIFWFLMSQRAALSARGVGATQRNISQTIIRDWPVPLPPLAEQHRVISALEDHVSRLDSARDYLSAAARRTASWRRVSADAALDVVGERTCLAELVERVEAGRSFGGAAAPARDDEWGVIRVSAMTWGEFRPQENKTVPAEAVDPRHEIRSGDVLVSRANTTEYVGAPVLVETTRPRLLLSDKSLRLVPRPGVDPRWLVEALATRAARRQVSALATGTKDSMRNISQANLLSVRLPMPPAEPLPTMEVVADIHQQGGRLCDVLGASAQRGTRLRQQLLAAAFTGLL